jgi:hypothetical protein
LPLLYESVFPQSFARVKDTEATVTIIKGYPSSSVQVLDAVTKKPIEGAKATIDTTEKLSDALGIIVLEVAEGEYTVKITHPAYLTKTLTVTIPMAEPLTVELWPLWTVGLGICAAATIGLAIGFKVMGKK